MNSKQRPVQATVWVTPDLLAEIESLSRMRGEVRAETTRYLLRLGLDNAPRPVFKNSLKKLKPVIS